MLGVRWGSAASKGRNVPETCWGRIVVRDSCRGVPQDGTGTRLVTGGGQVIVGQRGVCVGEAITLRGTLQTTPATSTFDSRVFPISKDSLLAGQSMSLASLPAHRTALRSTLRLGLPKGEIT